MPNRSMSQAHLASFLCSRLCHDLISPVGAIGNGLEILQEEGDDAMREQAIARAKAAQAEQEKKKAAGAVAPAEGEQAPQ